jgi:two-component system, NarL family, sensor histidine kinase DesK
MAMRSTDAATAQTSPVQAGTAQAGTGQGATDWTEQAVYAEASEQGVPGAGSPWRWFFSGVWLIYLIQPVAELFKSHDAAWIAGGVVITLAFCVIYLPVLMFSDTRPRLAVYGLGVLAVLATVACVVYGKSWTPLWIYVSAASGMVLTSVYDRRRAYLGVFAITGCYLLFCWITHLDMGTTLAVLVPVLLIGLAMVGFRLQLTLMRQLAQARETVAKLATNEERLRLARDMHDLTGQSLSMITLKSELAAKRLAKLPSSAERDAALTELGDIGRVSRQTLHDIREAVSGYRRPTLAIEVITARNALEAAGIALEDDAGLTLRSGTFDPDAEAVLAWCLREAVTNVIRHSRARHCRIRLAERMGEVSLEVTDDGRGFAGQAHDDPATPDVPDSRHGSGLRGVSERLSAIGGRLSLEPAGGPGPGHGFRLIATVPAGSALPITGGADAGDTTHNCML